MQLSLYLLPIVPPPPPPPQPFSHRPSAAVLPKCRPASGICCRQLGVRERRCVSEGGWGSSAVAELERELAAEGEEWLKVGRLEEKCGGGGGEGGGKGVVELLECLEREAIMGEDEGRAARDYNRRAKIFSTSSRVFQALKHHHSSDHASTQI